jgi:hypothetical protein
MSHTTEDMGFTVAISSAAATALVKEDAIGTRESAAIATIQQILSLKKGLGTPTVSISIEKAIHHVQEVLAKSADSWKKVDWRKGGDSRNHHTNNTNNTASSRQSSKNNITSRGAPSSPKPKAGGGSAWATPKYVSRFKGTEKVDDAVLLLIQDKLNKFSSRNYVETHAFMCQILDAGKTYFLKDFMRFVFKKATREEMMCSSYAQLLCELASKYEILLNEMVERYAEFSAIFADISEEEFTAEDYKALLEANSDKAYRLGYAQFLGELTKYNVLNTDLFVDTIQSIVSKIPAIVNAENGKRLLEDYCECLIRILRAIQTEKSTVATALRLKVKERFLEPLMPYTVKGCCASYKSLSPKGRCMILDITDMIKKY